MDDGLFCFNPMARRQKKMFLPSGIAVKITFCGPDPAELSRMVVAVNSAVREVEATLAPRTPEEAKKRGCGCQGGGS